MHRISLLIILVICSLPTILAATSKNVTITFSSADFSLSQYNGESTILSLNHNATVQNDTTQPELPLIPIHILIRCDEDIESYSVSTETELYREDVVLSPCEQLRPVSQERIGVSRFPVYTRSYPDSVAIYEGCYEQNGYKFAHFLVSPFLYDGVGQKLYLHTEINIQLNLVLIEGEMANSGTEEDNSLREYVSNMAINSSELNALYPPKMPTEVASAHYEYLIITSDSLASAFNRLANWKNRKGVRSKVMTTNFIASNYPGSTMQEKIKTAIKDYHNGTYNGLKYVLLGGDSTNVPTLYTRVYMMVGDVVEDDLPPIDYYYSCLSDLNWDKNNNGIYGEPADSVDINPSVYVTRLPVNNSITAQASVDKILGYEREPYLEDWDDRILLSGSKVDKYVEYDGQTISDVQKAGILLFSNISKYWHGQQSRLFDTFNDCLSGSQVFNAYYFGQVLHNSYTFIDVYTHGFVDKWQFKTNDSYVTSFSDFLRRNRYTLISTEACYTAKFTEPNCLASSFMNNGRDGIIAYIGCSAKNWTNHGTSFNINFYRDLFLSKWHRFGEALFNAKRGLIFSSFDSNVHRWLLFSITGLGDPELPMYIYRPNTLDNISIYFVNDTLVVDTNTTDCTICATSVEDYGQTYFDVHRDVSHCSFIGAPDSVFICVTKPGFIPYQAMAYRTYYLQNETITTNRHIAAQRTFVGSDVTATKPEGPVEVQSGNLSISIGNGVELKNNFIVKKGATLNIYKTK